MLVLQQIEREALVVELRSTSLRTSTKE